MAGEDHAKTPDLVIALNLIRKLSSPKPSLDTQFTPIGHRHRLAVASKHHNAAPIAMAVPEGRQSWRSRSRCQPDESIRRSAAEPEDILRVETMREQDRTCAYCGAARCRVQSVGA